MPGGFYPPLSVIESWPAPNYVDPETQGPALTYVCIIFSLLSLFAVAARTYSRVFITKAPGIDDILIAVALAFALVIGVLVIVQQKIFLIGRHIWDTPIDRFSGQRQLVYICEWCYLAATCAVKISILLFYRRLSGTFSKSFLIATWAGILYNVLYGIAFSITLLTVFKPIDAYWLSFDPAWAVTHKFSHGDETVVLPLNAALSVVGDFYSTVLPLMLVSFLDLPRRQKAALYALFGLGFIVVAAGIVRTVLLVRSVSQTYDVTWLISTVWIWTVIELNLAILAASAPALKPFLRRFLVEPIIESGRQASSIINSHRRSSSGRVRAAQHFRFRWSNGSSTARDSNNLPVDVEKIGIVLPEPQRKAVTIEQVIDDDLSMRQYTLRASANQDGKLMPVLIHEQGNLDECRTHTASSSVYSLPLSKTGEVSPILSEQRYQHRSGNWNRVMYNTRGPLERNPSQSSTNPTTGMVRATQPHINYLQEFDQQGHTHSRSSSAGSANNLLLPGTPVLGSGRYYEESDREDTYLYDGNASVEILGLPSQCKRYGRRWSGVDFAL